MQYLYQAMRMVGYVETYCKANTLNILFHLRLNFGSIYPVTYYVISLFIFFQNLAGTSGYACDGHLCFLPHEHFVLG